MKDNFDYKSAVAELEKIVGKVEDPATSIDSVDALLKRSAELIAGCRAYLRTARENADKIIEE